MINEFLSDILDNKNDCYYVELGSGHPLKGSVSLELENKGWRGLSLEIDEKIAEKFNSVRKNKCVVSDATKFNYRKYFEDNNFPKQIDLLQVDIDAGYTQMGKPVASPYNSLHGLISIPLTTYRFSVITFEHECIIDFKNESIKQASREILYSLDYALVKKFPHEDWWVDPNVVPYNIYKEHFQSVG